MYFLNSTATFLRLIHQFLHYFHKCEIKQTSLLRTDRSFQHQFQKISFRKFSILPSRPHGQSVSRQSTAMKFPHSFPTHSQRNSLFFFMTENTFHSRDAAGVKKSFASKWSYLYHNKILRMFQLTFPC